MPLLQVKTAIFSGYNDMQMNSDAGKILVAIGESELAAKLDQDYKTASEIHTAYVPAYNDAATGNRKAIATKNVLKGKLAMQMEVVAIGVNYFGRGNRPLLESTLIPLVKKNEPLDMRKPEGLTVVNIEGSQGSVGATIKSAPGATSFLFQWTEEPVTPASLWHTKGSTGKSCTISGFTSGQRISFRVIAVGTRNRQLISDIVSILIL